jgi:hypothetical protein
MDAPNQLNFLDTVDVRMAERNRTGSVTCRPVHLSPAAMGQRGGRWVGAARMSAERTGTKYNERAEMSEPQTAR